MKLTPRSLYMYISPISMFIYDNCITSHPNHQHPSTWVSSACLNRAAQTQESPLGSVLITGGHNNNNVRLRLLPPMCRYVIACFQRVKSAYVTKPHHPRTFLRERLWDKKIRREHLCIVVNACATQIPPSMSLWLLSSDKPK